MSYRIEYAHQVVFKQSVAGQMRYAIAVLGGDNNVWRTCYGRGGKRYEARARSWGLQFLGTAQQIMADACLFASDTCGGSLKPRGRDVTPESYVRLISRLLDQPVGGRLMPVINVSSSQVGLRAAIEAQGRTVCANGTRWGEAYFKAGFQLADAQDMVDYFGIWDRGFCPEGSFAAWSFGEVLGLPNPYAN